MKSSLCIIIHHIHQILQEKSNDYLNTCKENIWGNSVQFSSVAQSCLTLCDPMDHSTPGLPFHHQLLELPQTHVHWVGDTIQPSHPLLSPSLSAFNLSQHRGLFKWVSSSHQVARVLRQSSLYLLKTANSKQTRIRR